MASARAILHRSTKGTIRSTSYWRSRMVIGQTPERLERSKTVHRLASSSELMVSASRAAETVVIAVSSLGEGTLHWIVGFGEGEQPMGVNRRRRGRQAMTPLAGAHPGDRAG